MPRHNADSKYKQIAQRAAELAESKNAARDAGRLQCKDNMLLYFFLRGVVKDLEDNGGEDQGNWKKAVRRGTRSTFQHLTRIYDDASFSAVPNVGPALLGIVKSHLWSTWPPAPQTEEEAATEAACAAAESDRKAAEKQRRRQAKAAEKAAANAASALRAEALPDPLRPPGQIPAASAAAAAAAAAPDFTHTGRSSPAVDFTHTADFTHTGGFGIGGPTGFSPPDFGPPPPAGGSGRGRGRSGGGRGRGRSRNSATAAACTPPDADDSADTEAGGRKTKKQTSKPYKPNLGTANYAFLICLYQAHMEGEAFLTKAELMRRADASGLATRPGAIYGNQSAVAGPGRPQFAYDGWNGIPRMENNEPPLLQTYSNPKKVKLTTEGFELARQLHEHAVLRGTAQPLPATAGVPPQYAAAAAAGAVVAAAALPDLPPHLMPPAKRQRSSYEVAADCTGRDALPPLLAPRTHLSAAAAAAASAAASHDALPPLPAPRTHLSAPAASAAASATVSRDLLPPLTAPCTHLGAAATSSAVGLLSSQEEPRDADVARLMDMGFDAARACKALRSSGGCVEAALDVIELSDSDTEYEPQAASAATGITSAEQLLPEPTGLTDGDIIDCLSDSSPLRPPRRQPAPSTAATTVSAAAATASAAASGAVARAAAAVPLCGSNESRVHSQQLRAAAGHAAGQQEAVPAQMSSASGSGGELPRQLSGQSRQAPCPLPETQLLTAPLRNPSGGLGDDCIRLPPLPPGSTFADVYDILLLVDSREQFSRSIGGRAFQGRSAGLQHHVQQLVAHGVAAEVTTLATGDAAWAARSRHGGATYLLDWLVERKSVSDLAASIKDGRYESQKGAMRASGLRRLLYVVEGSLDQLESPTECRAVQTAAVRTHIIDGFEVLHTANIGDTLRCFVGITRALEALYAPLRSCDVATDSDPLPQPQQLAGLVAQQRGRAQPTVGDIWARMLASVRGLGPEAAEAVSRRFPTPLLLFEAIAARIREADACGGNTHTAPAELLQDVEIYPGRRIGPSKARNILALFESGWQAV